MTMESNTNTIPVTTVHRGRTRYRQNQQHQLLYHHDSVEQQKQKQQQEGEENNHKKQKKKKRQQQQRRTTKNKNHDTSSSSFFILFLQVGTIVFLIFFGLYHFYLLYKYNQYMTNRNILTSSSTTTTSSSNHYYTTYSYYYFYQTPEAVSVHFDNHDSNSDILTKMKMNQKNHHPNKKNNWMRIPEQWKYHIPVNVFTHYHSMNINSSTSSSNTSREQQQQQLLHVNSTKEEMFVSTDTHLSLSPFHIELYQLRQQFMNLYVRIPSSSLQHNLSDHANDEQRTEHYSIHGDDADDAVTSAARKLVEMGLATYSSHQKEENQNEVHYRDNKNLLSTDDDDDHYHHHHHELYYRLKSMILNHHSTKSLMTSRSSCTTNNDNDNNHTNFMYGDDPSQHDEQEQEQIFTIFVMGTSATAGYGNDHNQSYAHILRTILQPLFDSMNSSEFGSDNNNNHSSSTSRNNVKSKFRLNVQLFAYDDIQEFPLTWCTGRSKQQPSNNTVVPDMIVWDFVGGTRLPSYYDLDVELELVTRLEVFIRTTSILYSSHSRTRSHSNYDQQHQDGQQQKKQQSDKAPLYIFRGLPRTIVNTNGRQQGQGESSSSSSLFLQLLEYYTDHKILIDPIVLHEDLAAQQHSLLFQQQTKKRHQKINIVNKTMDTFTNIYNKTTRSSKNYLRKTKSIDSTTTGTTTADDNDSDLPVGFQKWNAYKISSSMVHPVKHISYQRHQFTAWLIAMHIANSLESVMKNEFISSQNDNPCQPNSKSTHDNPRQGSYSDLKLPPPFSLELIRMEEDLQHETYTNKLTSSSLLSWKSLLLMDQPNHDSYLNQILRSPKCYTSFELVPRNTGTMERGDIDPQTTNNKNDNSTLSTSTTTIQLSNLRQQLTNGTSRLQNSETKLLETLLLPKSTAMWYQSGWILDLDYESKRTKLRTKKNHWNNNNNNQNFMFQDWKQSYYGVSESGPLRLFLPIEKNILISSSNDEPLHTEFPTLSFSEPQMLIVCGTDLYPDPIIKTKPEEQSTKKFQGKYYPRSCQMQKDMEFTLLLNNHNKNNEQQQSETLLIEMMDTSVVRRTYTTKRWKQHRQPIHPMDTYNNENNNFDIDNNDWETTNSVEKDEMIEEEEHSFDDPNDDENPMCVQVHLPKNFTVTHRTNPPSQEEQVQQQEQIEYGIYLDITVVNPYVSWKYGPCSISHVIWFTPLKI